MHTSGRCIRDRSKVKEMDNGREKENNAYKWQVIQTFANNLDI